MLHAMTENKHVEERASEREREALKTERAYIQRSTHLIE